jgi:tetratricopeptide (TPR) repeat protein
MNKGTLNTLKGTRQLAGSLCLVLLISACSSTPMTKILLRDNSLSQQQVELTATPFFPQQKYQCGPAALATVLHFQDQTTLPDELINKVYIPEKQGSVPIEMIAAARSYEQLVYPLNANLENLLLEVATGHPVLVMQNLGFSWQPQWHYAVLIGYDLSSQQLMLRSGTEKRLTLPLKTFERTWRRANYWAQVILPPTQIPATAQAPRYLKAAQDLEATGHITSALQAYQSAINKWPGNPLPSLAQGNAYYAQGDLNRSEQSFRQALTKHTDSGELWNNLGYVLLAQGCQQQAQRAVQCAIQLHPENTDYQQSLSEISETPITSVATSNTAQCQPVNCPP